MLLELPLREIVPNISAVNSAGLPETTGSVNVILSVKSAIPSWGPKSSTQLTLPQTLSVKVPRFVRLAEAGPTGTSTFKKLALV
jgi:hypothetical protein